MLSNKIQKLYKEVKKLELLSDEADEKMMENPENDDFEVMANEAYKTYFYKREELVQLLMNTLNIERHVINKLLAHENFERLMEMTIV